MTRAKEKAPKKLKIFSWHPAACLKTDEDIANYLETVLEDGDPALLELALDDIARAKGKAG